MIHAAMEPVQVVTVVSAVQIKSFLGMDFERFRCWEGRAWPTFKIARDGRMDYDWLTVVKPWMRQTWKDFQKKKRTSEPEHVYNIIFTQQNNLVSYMP